MQSNNMRFLTVTAAIVLSFLFFIPSVRYFYATSVTPLPQRNEFKSEEEFTSKTLEYNQYMTHLRQGIPFLGQPIPLGLDLQGGVDVLLSVSREKIVEDTLRLTERRIRLLLQKESVGAEVELTPKNDALKIRVKDPANSDRVQVFLNRDYLQTFETWNQNDLKDPQNGLTLRLLKDRIDHDATNAIESAMETVRRRVDELGVTMPTVLKVGNDFIRVQIPGERDPERAISQIIRPANLEFRMLHNDNDKLIKELEFDTYGAVIKGQVPTRYTIRFGKSMPTRDGKPNLNEKTIQFKSELRGEKERTEKVIPYIVREEPELTGHELADARYQYNAASTSGSPHEVDVEFNKEGTRVFRDVTEKHLLENMAILLEGKVESAPKLVAHITDGRARITGSFTSEEARDLSLVLRAGALPTQLKVEQKQAVGATLGLDAVRKGVNSLLVGSIVVVVFMVVYYMGAGIVSVLALAVNLLMLMAVMAMSKATLTLSGIGGILLTVGMAVDCNVLIAERLREEVVLGGPLKSVINRSFNRAFATIFDSNLTTMITTLTLLQFGTASMQGFALTMVFGHLCTLFTGTFVSRAFTDVEVNTRGKLSVGFLRLIHGTKIPFIELRHLSYGLSVVLILLTIGGVIYKKGLNLGPDFEGGVTATVEFADKKVSDDDIRKILQDAQVQRVLDVGTNQLIITHKLIDGNVQATEDYMRATLTQSYPGKHALIGVQSIGASVSAQFVGKALWCILIAAIGVLIYVWFRFELDFGGAAVIALFHDIIITVGFLLWMNIQVSLDVVAALLTIFGYSLSDTIVNFDRIRENLSKHLTPKLATLIDNSLNQCLSRTIITSLTVIMTLICMLLLGGAGLHDFAITMLFGVFIGTYSSDFIAAPLVFDWRRWKGVTGTARETETKPSNGGEQREEEEGRPSESGKPAGPHRLQGPKTQGVRVAPIQR
ncbi:MAG: protein translocase subunit SecD [Candidatus Sumerlaeota bacterium]|nr:protein translocase subunit SecD [Candidatus Sumerlaeota bacterium]